MSRWSQFNGWESYFWFWWDQGKLFPFIYSRSRMTTNYFLKWTFFALTDDKVLYVGRVVSPTSWATQLLHCLLIFFQLLSCASCLTLLQHFNITKLLLATCKQSSEVLLIFIYFWGFALFEQCQGCLYKLNDLDRKYKHAIYKFTILYFLYNSDEYFYTGSLSTV